MAGAENAPPPAPLADAPITPVNSRGSYFSLKFSRRFESSSKTLRLASTDLTMSEGCTSCSSMSSNLCLKRNLSVALLVGSNLASASPPLVAFKLREPEYHFSYFSSNERMRSSKLGDCGAVSLSELVGLGLGCLGGGDAGGWGAECGLCVAGMLGARDGLVILFTCAALLLVAVLLLPPPLLFVLLVLLLLLLLLFIICVANLGNGNDSGPS